MIFIRNSKKLLLKKRCYVTYDKDMLKMSYEEFTKKVDSLRENPLYETINREMVKRIQLIIKELKESEIWFEYNSKEIQTPLDLENAKSNIEKVRKEVLEKYKNLEKKHSDPKKKKEFYQKLATDLNDHTIFSSAAFKEMENLMEKQTGQKISDIKGKKVTDKDVKMLMQLAKTPEFQDMAKDLDKIFTDEKMKELGLKGEMEDELHDETKIEHARHFLKKEMEKNPHHAELLNTQFGGKDFKEVFEGFVEEGKKNKKSK